MRNELSDDLLESILKKYGEDEQLIQLMGECGELTAACQNYRRSKKYGYRSETLEKVMEEAVDVFFMIQQIKILDRQLFDDLCIKKLNKVLEKIKNEG